MKFAITLLAFSILSFGQTSKVEHKIGEKIQGNFLGNGKKITATVIKTKKAIGNPVVLRHTSRAVR